MALTGKASLSFYVVAILAQGATTATSVTVQQHAYHDTDHKVSSASAHTQGLTPSDVTVGGLPAWVQTEVVEATDGAQYHTDRTYAFRGTLDPALAGSMLIKTPHSFYGGWTPTITAPGTYTIYAAVLTSMATRDAGYNDSLPLAGWTQSCAHVESGFSLPWPRNFEYYNFSVWSKSGLTGTTTLPESVCTTSCYGIVTFFVHDEVIDPSCQGTGASATGTDASATGDPHLQNIHGERFDLMKPGKVVLIKVPRGEPVENALLTVEADARRLGLQCADIYFQSLNLTGAWADKVRAGGLTFTAGGARDETLQIPGWTRFGPLQLKVVNGRTSQGTEYLNFYVKHLRDAGAAVGGLLGEDDYTEAARPEEGCEKLMSLKKRVISNSDVGHTEAIASLA